MGKLERITFTVPTELAEKLRAAVAGGTYATTSEVVREALRDWNDERERRDAENASIRESLARARAGGRKTAAEVEKHVLARIAAVERNRSKASA